jgi:hypothetical protein
LARSTRRGREHLVQYVLRPALAQQRLARLSDGRVVLTLPRPWRDGTRALVFAPLTVLERLAAEVDDAVLHLPAGRRRLAGWHAEAEVPAVKSGSFGSAKALQLGLSPQLILLCRSR